MQRVQSFRSFQVHGWTGELLYFSIFLLTIKVLRIASKEGAPFGNIGFYVEYGLTPHGNGSLSGGGVTPHEYGGLPEMSAVVAHIVD